MIEVKHLEKYYGSDGTVTKLLMIFHLLVTTANFYVSWELPVPEKARF